MSDKEDKIDFEAKEDERKQGENDSKIRWINDSKIMYKKASHSNTHIGKQNVIKMQAPDQWPDPPENNKKSKTEK